MDVTKLRCTLNILTVKSIYYRFFIVCIGLCCISDIAIASDDLSEDDFFDDVPIVLNASRLSQAFNESPVPVTVIDRKMIEASGFTDITELFRLVPGFVSGHYRGNQTLSGYLFVDDSIPRSLQVIVDGRSVYTPTLGGPIWATLPLNIDDIERIEVVRGPNAAAYGSNAFLGVINIITRTPGTYPGWTVRANAGDPGLLQGSVQYDGRAEKLSYRFSAWYEEEDGFDNLHDGKHVPKFSGRLDYQVNSRNRLSFQLGASNADIDRDEPQDDLTPEHQVDQKADFQMVRWDRTLDESSSFYLKFYRSYDEATEHVDLQIPGIGEVYVEQDYKSTRYDLEFQYNQSLKQGLDVAWGASVRRDSAVAPVYLGKFDPARINVSRIFAHAFWNINEKFFTNAGLMIEHTNITSTNILPLLSLHYRLNKNNTLRLSMTKASRLPVAFEEYTDTKLEVPEFGLVDQIFFEQVDLDAETINTVNLGLVGKSPENNLSYDISLSRHHVRNHISMEGSEFPVASSDEDDIDNINGSAVYFDDAGSLEIDNIEVSVKYMPTRKTDLIASYAYTEVDQKNIFAPDEMIANATPRHLFSLLATQKIGVNYKLSGGYYFVDKARYVDNKLIRPSTDRLDMRLARKLKFAKTSGEIALVGQDLLNNYQGLYPFNKMDRRFHLSLKLHFK